MGIRVYSSLESGITEDRVLSTIYDPRLNLGNRYTLITCFEKPFIGEEGVIVDSAKRYGIRANSIGEMSFDHGTGTKYNWEDSGIVISSNVKYWAGYSYYGTTKKLYGYLDNALILDVTTSKDDDSDCTRDLAFGAFGNVGGIPFSFGSNKIYFFALYNRDLSAEEILTVHNTNGAEFLFDGIVCAYNFLERTTGYNMIEGVDYAVDIITGDAAMNAIAYNPASTPAEGGPDYIPQRIEFRPAA